MKTVAEGVEEKEQVEFLAKHNCDLIQGFYFSKPLPIEEFDYPIRNKRFQRFLCQVLRHIVSRSWNGISK